MEKTIKIDGTEYKWMDGKNFTIAQIVHINRSINKIELPGKIDFENLNSLKSALLGSDVIYDIAVATICPVDQEWWMADKVKMRVDVEKNFPIDGAWQVMNDFFMNSQISQDIHNYVSNQLQTAIMKPLGMILATLSKAQNILTHQEDSSDSSTD